MASSYADIAIAYAREAKRYRSRYCMEVRQAASRFLADLRRARAKDASFIFSLDHVEDVCGFVEKLPHVQGRWSTPHIRLEPAQIFWLANIFGFRNRSDGLRRFRRAYVEVARKNAKTTLMSALALYCLACDGEPAPIIVIGASTGDQARKVFEPAQAMVRRTQALRDAFGVEAWAHRITCADTAGYIQPIHAKSSTQDGWNPHVAILDEMHAHKDRGLYDVIRSAFGARRQPLMLMITTAGHRQDGVAWEQRTLVRKILAGAIEADHIWGVIYTLDSHDDPWNERKWIKANPLLGVSVSVEEMRQYALEARESPATRAEFLTKRCNLWLAAAETWLPMERWRACADPQLCLEDFDELEVGIGVDLADKDDIAALVMEAETPDGCVLWWPLFWIPRECIEQRDRDIGALYRQWAEAGHLRVTAGDFIDHRLIEEEIRGLCQRFRVRQVTFDQYGGAQIMAARLLEDGISAALAPKSARLMTDPAKDLEARVKAGPGRFRHPANPVLDWMASNATVTRRVDGSLLPKKASTNSPHKIDGIDAGLMAALPRLTAREEEEPMPYEHRDMVVLG